MSAIETMFNTLKQFGSDGILLIESEFHTSGETQVRKAQLTVVYKDVISITATTTNYAGTIRSIIEVSMSFDKITFYVPKHPTLKDIYDVSLDLYNAEMKLPPHQRPDSLIDLYNFLLKLKGEL